MTDKPHTPTVDELRRMYALKVPHDQRDRRNAEFDRFLAAAKQRGAIKALRDAADYLAENKQIVIDGDEYTACNSCTVIQYDYLTYRVDQMEGDE